MDLIWITEIEVWIQKISFCLTLRSSMQDTAQTCWELHPSVLIHANNTVISQQILMEIAVLFSFGFFKTFCNCIINIGKQIIKFMTLESSPCLLLQSCIEYQRVATSLGLSVFVSNLVLKSSALSYCTARVHWCQCHKLVVFKRLYTKKFSPCCMRLCSMVVLVLWITLIPFYSQSPKLTPLGA